MFIPFDNLYDFIAGRAPGTLIYRFDPPGSKKLQDLAQINRTNHLGFTEWMEQIPLVCHDQEPLNFDLNALDWQELRRVCLEHLHQYTFITRNRDNEQFWKDLVARNVLAGVPHTLADRAVLLHSEKQSAEINKFGDLAVPAYWWCHAALALDWYRFANWDHRIWQWPDHAYQYDFNIYSRAWTGSREYRLHFLNQVVNNDLLPDCRVTFDHVDRLHYHEHAFANPDFFTSRALDQIESTSISSAESGGYDVNHYSVCGIDVVTETLFDDSRWHLTEKTLRPIACRKAFILLATAGSLEYLRSYGFRTFDGVIDESYDQVTNPKERISRIITEMKRISGLSQQQRKSFYRELQIIADYNHQHFFSNRFSQQVYHELTQNLSQALQQVKDQHMCGVNWCESRRHLSRERKRAILPVFQGNMTTSDIARLLMLCRQRRRHLKKPVA